VPRKEYGGRSASEGRLVSNLGFESERLEFRESLFREVKRIG
jgi:hypothetical protein